MVVDNQLPTLSHNDRRNYNPYPRCGAALSVASATPRRSPP